MWPVPGFSRKGLLITLLIMQFTALPTAIAYDDIGSRFGQKDGILIGMLKHMAVPLGTSVMTTSGGFYLPASMIGLAKVKHRH